MLLVDTNIIAPLYVRSARSPAVAELFARDPVWRTEPLALIELSNVLITYERARYITTARARDCLNRAAAFLQPTCFVSVIKLLWMQHFAMARPLTTHAFSHWRSSSVCGW